MYVIIIVTAELQLFYRRAERNIRFNIKFIFYVLQPVPANHKVIVIFNAFLR